MHYNKRENISNRRPSLDPNTTLDLFPWIGHHSIVVTYAGTTQLFCNFFFTFRSVSIQGLNLSRWIIFCEALSGWTPCAGKQNWCIKHVSYLSGTYTFLFRRPPKENQLYKCYLSLCTLDPYFNYKQTFLEL